MKKILLLCVILISCVSCKDRLFKDDPEEKPQPNPYFVFTDFDVYNEKDFWATEVLEVLPGPGQHTNRAEYSLTKDNWKKVLGPPKGGGTYAPDNSSIVSLHGPGASLTLRFDPPLLDHPDNIGGYDFIVFGNAFWVSGSPKVSWQEPGYIEVMKDENGNGKPDDKWYIIPGSHFTEFPLNTTSVTLKKQGPHDTAWPSKLYFPGFPDECTYSYYALPPFIAGNVAAKTYGYVDGVPTLILGDMSGAGSDNKKNNSISDPEDMKNIAPMDFYCVPDTPYDLCIDRGTGGGEAIKIEWAVDPAAGKPVNLDRVDFIRFTNPFYQSDGAFADVDPELDAVARVRRGYAVKKK